MKRSKLVLIIVAFTGFIIEGAFNKALGAQNSSLLWKVEGNGIQTSYIFGTFHIIPKSDFGIKEKVINSFDQCESMIMEMDLTDPELGTKIQQNAKMSDNASLKSFLNKKDFALIDSILLANYGQGLEPMQNLKPFMLTSMILPIYIKEEQASYEASLIEMALEKNIDILALETPEEQLSIFDRISYQSQTDDLVEMINKPVEAEQLLDEMIAHYKEEDIYALQNMFLEYYNSENEIEEILYRRNKIWSQKIPEMIQNKSAFIAVGAGHLGGEKGLIQLLKDKGYELSPIF